MMLANPLRTNLSIASKLKYLGPGLLMAGAAVGVSHLVQSTRAGADYGFSLILLVILVNILKYPFFEFGHRYAAFTGENLLQGYRRLGKGYLYLFLLLNLFTAVISIAGVTFVTAALATLLFPDHLDTTELSAIIMLFCSTLIFIGHYKLLSKVMKVIMMLLCVSSILAFVMAFLKTPLNSMMVDNASPWTLAAFPFLIALLGWMPAPIELSVWQSLWIQADNDHAKKRTTWENASFDFNVGYILMVGLAVIFVCLGALVMHGSGESFSDSGATFAAQLVNMYTSVLGTWTMPIIAVAALCTMFSTTLTVIDAYPRSLAEGFKIAFKLKWAQRHLQWVCIVIGCLFAVAIIHSYMNHFKQMIDLATSIAFVAAPIFAYLNYKLIMSDHTAIEAKPTRFIRGLSLFGICFLSTFALIYIASLVLL